MIAIKNEEKISKRRSQTLLNFLKDRFNLFNRYNAYIFLATMALVMFGTIMIYAASYNLYNYVYLKKQLMWFFIGFCVLCLLSFLPHKILKSKIVVYGLLSIAFLLLIIVLIPGVGVKIKGSARWIRFAGINFQPSEIMRFAMLIFLSYSLSKKQEAGTITQFAIGYIPHIIIVMVCFFLIALEPDYSSATFLILFTYILMLCAGVKLVHLILPTVFIFPVLYYVAISKGYRVMRIISFLNPWDHRTEGGYQHIQSFIAYGLGRFKGVGLGEGAQKLGYIPEAHTDFIFPIIAEEIGFAGVLIVLFVYGIIFTMGVIVARRAKDTFSTLLAMGIVLSLAFNVSINMLVTLGLLPVTGMALPFFSYGGTSLIINMACIGILMNVAARNEAKIK